MTRKKQISEALEYQLKIQQILSDHKKEMLLPEDVVKELRLAIDKLLVSYQRLAAAATSEGLVIFNFPTKWHWLWHLGERASYLNPRRAATMLNEDFVGKMKDLTHSCAAGTELHQIAMKGCEKYRWGFHFQAGM